MTNTKRTLEPVHSCLLIHMQGKLVDVYSIGMQDTSMGGEENSIVCKEGCP